MLKKLPLILLTLLALAACGEEKEKQINFVPDVLEDPLAYFGVETCTCYEYRSLDPKEPRLLGVAVERVDELHSDPDDRKDVHEIVYRIGGTPEMRYVFEAGETELRLTRVSTGEDSAADEWRLKPALPFLRWPVEARTSIRQEVDAGLFQGGKAVGEPEARAVQVNFTAMETVTASLGGGEEEAFEAIRIEFANTPWNEARRWFVPEVGNVKLELRLGGERSTWVLENVRQLDADSCPGKITVVDRCGAAAR